MLGSKIIVNIVANKLVKHFKLDKKVGQMDKRLNLLEKMAHLPKDCKCKGKNA